MSSTNESGETFTQPYAKLCIATGARAIYPPIPGIELPGVFTLRSLSDAQQIHAYMQEHPMQVGSCHRRRLYRHGDGRGNA